MAKDPRKRPDSSGQKDKTDSDSSGQRKSGKLSVAGNVNAEFLANEIKALMSGAGIDFGYAVPQFINRLHSGKNVLPKTIKDNVANMLQAIFEAADTQKNLSSLASSWVRFREATHSLGIFIPSSPSDESLAIENSSKSVSDIYSVLAGEKIIPPPPNHVPTGESLSQPPSKLILGAIIPHATTNPFFGRLGSELSRIANSKKVQLIGLSKNVTSPKDAMDLCRQFGDLDCAGVFFVPFEYNSEAGNYNTVIANELSGNAGAQVVLLDRGLNKFPERSNFDIVRLDNLAAGQILIAHILPKIKKPKPKIIFIEKPISANSIRLRLMGVNAGLIHHNQVPIASITCDTSDTHSLRSLKLGGYDAAICANDETAQELHNFMVESRLPKQPLLAAFDRLWPDRPWISVPQPIAHIARAAWMLMRMRIAEDSECQRTDFPRMDFPKTTVLIQPNDMLDVNV